MRLKAIEVLQGFPEVIFLCLHGCSMYACVYVFRHMHAMACVKVREQIWMSVLAFLLV